MPYTMTVDPTRHLVRVDYTGTISIAERTQAMDACAGQLEASGWRRVLVVLTAATHAAEPLQLSNSFATRLAAHAPINDSRLAYVVAPHEHANRLIEHLAAARHVALRSFHEVDAAERWLLADDIGA